MRTGSLFQIFGAVRDVVEHREIAIDQRIEQRVEEEPSARGLPSSATLARQRSAVSAITGRPAVVERHHVVLAEENIDLMALAAVSFRGQSVEDDELVAVVLVDFRALPAPSHIFQGQRVKPELLPDVRDLLRSRVDHVDPDSGVLPRDDFLEVFEASFGDRTVRAGVQDDVDHAQPPMHEIAACHGWHSE